MTTSRKLYLFDAIKETAKETNPEACRLKLDTAYKKDLLLGPYNPCALNERKQNIVIVAVLEKNFVALQWIMQKKILPDLNWKDDKKKSALMYAASPEHFDLRIFEYLFNCCVDQFALFPRISADIQMALPLVVKHHLWQSFKKFLTEQHLHYHCKFADSPLPEILKGFKNGEITEEITQKIIKRLYLLFKITPTEKDLQLVIDDLSHEFLAFMLNYFNPPLEAALKYALLQNKDDTADLLIKRGAQLTITEFSLSAFDRVAYCPFLNEMAVAGNLKVVKQIIKHHAIVECAFGTSFSPLQKLKQCKTPETPEQKRVRRYLKAVKAIEAGKRPLEVKPFIMKLPDEDKIDLAESFKDKRWIKDLLPKILPVELHTISASKKFLETKPASPSAPNFFDSTTIIFSLLPSSFHLECKETYPAIAALENTHFDSEKDFVDTVFARRALLPTQFTLFALTKKLDALSAGSMTSRQQPGMMTSF